MGIKRTNKRNKYLIRTGVKSSELWFMLEFQLLTCFCQQAAVCRFKNVIYDFLFTNNFYSFKMYRKVLVADLTIFTLIWFIDKCCSNFECFKSQGATNFWNDVWWTDETKDHEVLCRPKDSGQICIRLTVKGRANWVMMQQLQSLVILQQEVSKSQDLRSCNDPVQVQNLNVTKVLG